MRLIDKYIICLFYIVWVLLIALVGSISVLGPLIAAIIGFATNDKILAATGLVFCLFIPVGLKLTDMMIEVLRK